MHYYIDGYNLLFALFGPTMSEFTSRREWLIQTLNIKAEFLALEISLVFDSHFCEGVGSRSHFHHLEILYTPKDVSADDFIIKKIEKSSDPTKTLLVTNDRALTLRARNLLANTQSLNEFTNWLDRRYKNKTQKKSKPVSSFKLSAPLAKTQNKIPSTPLSGLAPEPEKLTSASKILPKTKQPSEGPLISEGVPGTLEYYLKHFESADELCLMKLEEKKMKRKERKKRER